MLVSLKPLFHHALHDQSYRGRFAVGLNLLIATMVILNIIEVVWLSIPEYAERYAHLAELTLSFFVIFFALEYLLRVWSAGVKTQSGLSKHHGRLAYIFSPMGLIDLFSFLPIMLVWFLPHDSFGDLRILKLISIIRILKLTRYSDSLSMLAHLYRDNRRTLTAAAMVMMILSFLAATGIYLFEREAQPEVFGSIPACMWWALVTLTTVGYGDMVPLTMAGKLFGVLVMISGVGIAAMPAGIFASSFVQLIREQERQRRKAYRQGKALETAAELSSDGALSVDFFTRSEKRELDYLMVEFGLSFEQAAAVIMHYRH